MCYSDVVLRLLVQCSCDTVQSAQDLQLNESRTHVCTAGDLEWKLLSAGRARHSSLFQKTFCCDVSWQANTIIDALSLANLTLLMLAGTPTVCCP